MSRFEEVFAKVLSNCKKRFHEDVINQKKSEFSVCYKRYLNIYLSQEEISKLFSNCKCEKDIFSLYQSLVKFLRENGAKITRRDNGVMLVLQWQNIKYDLLQYFCEISEVSPSIIQSRVFSDIRKSIQYNLNCSEMDIQFTRNLALKLIQLLVYCSINPKVYFSDWFKRTQLYEGDNALQNPIAQKNIRTLIKSLKSK